LAAAESLASEGIELEVIDPRTLVPLDIATIVRSVERTNRLLVCHEAPRRGGWAAEVAMQVGEQAFDALDAPVARVCGADVPVPYSGSLEPVVVPGIEQVVAGMRALLEGN
jgi:pyruvate/2-oxoglutarate/acetoin dehydrogenase E1 component